jgi:hypothetical protein
MKLTQTAQQTIDIVIKNFIYETRATTRRELASMAGGTPFHTTQTYAVEFPASRVGHSPKENQDSQCPFTVFLKVFKPNIYAARN